ncbi:MAG: hypothetical protein MUO27_10600, partial [Sedimentisphaerales bacterium]|nr:hypothetical protein [Sedimentisphaerales bacterium]
EIDETSNKAEPIVLTATYLTEGDRFCDRRVLFIDKSTKFVTKIEYYVFKEGKYTYSHATEYFDYNVPIDANMFNLSDGILPDTRIIDTRTQDIGLAQGNLTDEEIPIKVVREFIEALIAKDYAKAGQIYGGVPPAELEQGWTRQVIRLISVGQGVQPEKLHKIHPKSVLVPCTIEIERDGQISRQSHEFFVATVVGRRDRWEIQSSKSLK